MKKKIKKKTDASYNKIHMEKKKKHFYQKTQKQVNGKNIKKELHRAALKRSSGNAY